MADRVIVAVFATQNHAYDAARQVQNLDKDDIIQLKRGAIATKDDKGNLTIPDSKGVGTAWGLLGGGLIGGLLGAMLGPVGVAVGAAATPARNEDLGLDAPSVSVLLPLGEVGAADLDLLSALGPTPPPGTVFCGHSPWQEDSDGVRRAEVDDVRTIGKLLGHALDVGASPFGLSASR